VIERCLAHVSPDAVRASYFREDMLDERRAVLDAWGAYVTGK
jgi:hypothetical protein